MSGIRHMVNLTRIFLSSLKHDLVLTCRVKRVLLSTPPFLPYLPSFVSARGMEAEAQDSEEKCSEV